jgi:hypothetical protein
MRKAGTFFSLILIASCCSRAQTSGSAERTTPPALLDPATPTTARDKFLPFTERKRLHEFVKSWFSPISLLTCATGAAWGQLRDSPHEWGEGDKAFGERFISGYGQHLVNSTLLLTGTSLFHEDNRYVRSGQTGTGGRLGYALASSVMTIHYDPGGGSHRRVSVSRIVAFAGAALISRTWQPPSTRGVGHAGVSFAGTIAVTAGFNVVREFLNFK